MEQKQSHGGKPEICGGCAESQGRQVDSLIFLGSPLNISRNKEVKRNDDLGKEKQTMYIPEFACGFIVGAIVGVTTLIVMAIIADKRDK